MNTALIRGSSVLLLLLPCAALAHTGAGAAGFMQGFAHPFGGLDHLLAMVAVGVLAARFEGRQRWLLPIAFVLSMIVGGIVGAAALAVPFVEPAIALSVFVFGIAITTTGTFNLAAAAALVGAFAFFHGHAHGSEGVGASLASYSAGFVVATALLHAAGLGTTVLIGEWKQKTQTLRLGGSAVAAAGLALFGAALG